MKKYINVFCLNIKNLKMFKLDFYLSFISIPVQLIIAYLFWKNILGSSYSGDITLNSIIVYFLFLQVLQIGFSSAMYTTYELWNEINNGTIIIWLNRPVYYPIFILSQKLSSFTINILSSFIITFLSLFLMGYKISIHNFLFGVISSILGYILLFQIQFLIGCLTFWVKKVLVLRDTIMSLLFLIGGVIIPIDLTPLFIQKITFLTPIPYIYYLPAKIFSNQMEMLYIFKNTIYQISWIILFQLFIIIIWRFGTRDKINQGA